MDKYTELEKQAQKFLNETDTMQFSMVELLTMFYRHKQQLTLTDVVKSSDLWVVEFSDNEIKLMTSKELQSYEDECMEFDGFMGCSVLGRLAKSK